MSVSNFSQLIQVFIRPEKGLVSFLFLDLFFCIPDMN